MHVKTILVTGANKGIGLGIVQSLAKMGHEVILGARDLHKGRQATKSVVGNIHVTQLDVSQETSILRLADEIKQKSGKLDVLINNAGILEGKKGAEDIDLNKVKTVMDTNFYGAWRMAQVVIPLLKKRDDARVVNMSSGMGAHSDLVGGHAGYRLSKASLNALTILLSNELKGTIKVNAMCPGWVRTDMGGQGANRSIEQGADTAVWLATAEDIPTGKFFRDRKVIPW